MTSLVIVHFSFPMFIRLVRQARTGYEQYLPDRTRGTLLQVRMAYTLHKL